jgi:hypothetical protein
VLNGHSTVNKDLWASVIDRANMVTRAAAEHLQLNKLMARIDKRKNYYTAPICDLWNKLPSNVRAARTVRHFKYCYKQYKECERQGLREQ